MHGFFFGVLVRWPERATAGNGNVTVTVLAVVLLLAKQLLLQ
jgi:hypothetical protein